MKNAPVILVVDDDSAHRTMLRTLLSGWGYRVEEADDGVAAIAAVEQTPFDLVLMDIRMVTVSGIEALDGIKQRNPAIPVVMMTAYSSIETAVDALKRGAYDYLTKPFDFEKLKVTIVRALEHTQLTEENRRLREDLARQFDRQQIVGRSPVMERLLDTVAQVATSEATVLLTGESGTGKELIAEAVHADSKRKRGTFVTINCAAITETLLESELFGHEKGAFTGADRRKEGRFQQAGGGSIFLDEVSEMSLGMQVKLLRVIQEREVTRVGGSDTLPIDVRIIAATNRNLRGLVENGQFREDLYYRLNVVNIEVPPLRMRSEDIPLLAQSFLERFAEQNQKQINGFTPQAMEELIRYEWPGNVRELMNVVERAVVLARGDYLDPESLLLTAQGLDRTAVHADGGDSFGEGTTLDNVERATILKTLDATGGNKSEAARRLGITRKTLNSKLKKYGVMG